MRSADEFEAVQRLISTGLNDCAIARQTGIPRKRCGNGAAVEDRFERGFQIHHRPAALIMTSLHSPRLPTAICLASTSATVVSRDTPEHGGSESCSTLNTRGSLTGVARQSTS